jgi:hypothetical protein
VLDGEHEPTPPLVIGDGWCEKPFSTRSLINVSGMSYGAISKPAVQSLSHGAAKAGAYMDTGEGGLSPYHLEGGCDVIYQIGTAKYGVRDEHGRLDPDKLRQMAAHENVRAFEIKLSQGAKPGKGGVLPAAKVTEEIAKIRGIPAGQDSLSPNRHPETSNMDELLAMVEQVREITGKPVGIKTAIGGWQFMRWRVEPPGLQSAPDFWRLMAARWLGGPAGVGYHMALLSMGKRGGCLDRGLRDRSGASGKIITQPGLGVPGRILNSARGTCLRWAAFRPYAATRTVAQLASRLMMSSCSVGWM